MRRGRFVLAFLAIYLIWGSTYLAISVAVESIPPLAMMSVRSLAAGLILLAWSRRLAHTLDASAWRAAFIAGALLFLLSHGSLAWAELRVPSGIAAVLGATTPLWLALIDWRWGTGHVPGWFGRAGLVVGFAGVALLVAPAWGGARTGAGDRERRHRRRRAGLGGRVGVRTRRAAAARCSPVDRRPAARRLGVAGSRQHRDG